MLCCSIQTHKGITSTAHCTSFTYHNQDLQILTKIISVTPHIIYEIDTIYILQEKDYLKLLYLRTLYLLEVLMMKHFKQNVTRSQTNRLKSTKTSHKTLLKKSGVLLTTIFRVTLALMLLYTANYNVALSQRLIKILYLIHIPLQK